MVGASLLSDPFADADDGILARDEPFCRHVANLLPRYVSGHSVELPDVAVADAVEHERGEGVGRVEYAVEIVEQLAHHEAS